MKDVFVDSSGNVVCEDYNGCSLADAQVKNPTVTERIQGAPDAVTPQKVSFPTPHQYYYHQKTSGDGTDISHYTEVPVLDELKAQRNGEIDQKTAALIAQGFLFDSKVFSLSIYAQSNWTNLKNLEELLTWPVDVTTITDEEYSLSQANMPAFVGTAAATIQAHYDSGRALKLQINAASTKAEIDAIIDNR